MRLLFLQEFPLTYKAGGPRIISQLIKGKPDSVDTFTSYDKYSYSNSEEESIHTHFSLPRHFRFGIGRIFAFVELFCLNPLTIFSLIRLLRQTKADIVHITAHGPLVPAYVLSCLIMNKKYFLSIHDLWHLTVRGYVPEIVAHKIFRSIAHRAEYIFVICDTMGEYIHQKYMINSYISITDSINIEDYQHKVITAKIDKISFLYIGNLYAKQYDSLQSLIRAISTNVNYNVSFGFCTEYPVYNNLDIENISIINYGWVDEKEIASIAALYKFGLMPLSFSKDDELFYRTSFMTKLITYACYQLPTICLGSEKSSPNEWIAKAGTGIAITSLDDQEFQQHVRKIISLSKTDYDKMRMANLREAETTFNSKMICDMFYQKINEKAHGTISL